MIFKYFTILLPVLLFSANFLKVDKILKDEVLCLKKSPKIDAPSIGAIPYNTRCVELFKCKDDDNKTWCKVKYFQKIGWVEASKLSKDTNCTLDNNSTKVEQIIQIAKSKLGSPYRYGKSGPNSFDCSGFVYFVYKKAGIDIPRTSLDQSKTENKIARDKLQIGDIVAFDTANRKHVNHSGIYLGDGNFIHATSGKAFRVTISNLDKGFYKDKFRWGVRVVPKEKP